MGLDMYLIKRKKEKKELSTGELWNFKDELIYWRKANAIHKFLCDNGEKIEEQVSYKISKQVLKDLLNKCKLVIEKAKIEKGKVQNGQTLKDGKWEPILEDGEKIINCDEIAEILPTCSGFFFGSTDYDQWYLQDIKQTKEKLEEIINQIDYKNEDVYYLASW